MIDIKALRENPEVYKNSAKLRGVAVDIDKLLKLDKERITLIGQVEGLRAKLNIKGKPTPEELGKLQETKKELEELEKSFAKIDEPYQELLATVPNNMAENTPEGGEEANREERSWGGKPTFDFDAKDHLTLAEAKGWLDFERGAKVAGTKFYYLKGPLVRLELAISQMIFDLVEKSGLVPVMVPHMVSGRVLEATGYQPRGEEDQSYQIEGEDLTLIGTAEIPLTGYYADEILGNDQLPTAFIGLSPAYRKEAGAYGKYSKGLYRVHQFNKLEMYVFCKPEDSAEWHQKLVKLEEDIVQALELPYRVVRAATGDMGAPAYEKYDVEYWSPLEGIYRELMSCSNVTDYQARRLNIRYRNEAGELKFVHTLNGTAAAFSRTPIAILENHQTADGEVRIPKALQPYYGGDKL